MHSKEAIKYVCVIRTKTSFGEPFKRMALAVLTVDNLKFRPDNYSAKVRVKKHSRFRSKVGSLFSIFAPFLFLSRLSDGSGCSFDERRREF